MEDVAEAFDCVLHKGVTGEVYNIGTQKERTVLDVANDIAKIFNLPTSKITHVRDRAFNDRRYYICDNKLASLGEEHSPSAHIAPVGMVCVPYMPSCLCTPWVYWLMSCCKGPCK